MNYGNFNFSYAIYVNKNNYDFIDDDGINQCFELIFYNKKCNSCVFYVTEDNLRLLDKLKSGLKYKIKLKKSSKK